MLWSEDVMDRELCSELEQQQNGEKDNPNAGLEPRTFCYPGRCPKPVRLEGISYLRLMITLQVEHSGHRIPPEHAGNKRKSHRILQECTGNRRKWKQYSNGNFQDFFPVDSSQFSVLSDGKSVGNHRKKSEKFPVGILLPCSGDFQCLPAGTGPYFLTWV